MINKNQSTHIFFNQEVRKIAVIRTQAHCFQCACVKSSPYSGEIVSTTASICFSKVARKKYQNIVFLLIFRTRYVRWIFLNPSYTAPSGLILPGLAPGPPYKLGRSLSARLAGGESPLDSPKQARESRRFPKPYG